MQYISITVITTFYILALSLGQTSITADASGKAYQKKWFRNLQSNGRDMVGATGPMCRMLSRLWPFIKTQTWENSMSEVKEDN